MNLLSADPAANPSPLPSHGVDLAREHMDWGTVATDQACGVGQHQWCVLVEEILCERQGVGRRSHVAMDKPRWLSTTARASR